MKKHVPFSELAGKTLSSVVNSSDDEGDAITFTVEGGEVYRMTHDQDCCESVYIDDICGDLSDLVGSPIVQAEGSTSEEWPEGAEKPEYIESYTWTFYRIATAKGQVVIRWYGESNGYYSESASLYRVQ